MSLPNNRICRSAPRARFDQIKGIADSIRSYINRRNCRRASQARFSTLAALLLLTSAAHAADTLDLDGTTITGSQELPKALHIVPWKSADPGDLAGRPLNSLVDEILAPVDRDVFLRELEYYEAVHSSD